MRLQKETNNNKNKPNTSDADEISISKKLTPRFNILRGQLAFYLKSALFTEQAILNLN